MSRDSQTDSRSHSDVQYIAEDFSARSIMEISMMGGLDGINEPVGESPAKGRGLSSGGRGTDDALNQKAINRRYIPTRK